MEGAKFLSSTSTPGACCLLPCRKKSSKARNMPFTVLNMAASGGSKGQDYRGKLVDENMIVLRMRIQEKKLLEEGREAPPNWMEWEKKYYVHYNEDVCEALGLLQNYLMNIRPALAAGTVAFVSLSLLISVGIMTRFLIKLTSTITRKVERNRKVELYNK